MEGSGIVRRKPADAARRPNQVIPTLTTVDECPASRTHTLRRIAAGELITAITLLSESGRV